MNFKRLKNLYDNNENQLLSIKTGMYLEIHEKMGDWNNQRIWKFKCLVIKVKKPQHPDWTFTVRWESAGMTIEKIYPLSFPNFDKVILLDEYKARKSKLYYIRDKVWKDARMKSKIKSEDRNKNLLSETVDYKKAETKEAVEETTTQE